MKRKTKEWFAVSREGLRELQEGKPKHYILRELIQNAWDEDIKVCSVDLSYYRGFVTAVIKDDSPEGFKDLTDSYTLYKHTYKRADPTKRGRFNLGEKQAFALCNTAIIETTKGTVEFNRDGRFTSTKKTNSGTTVKVTFKANETEYEEILKVIRSYRVPQNITFTVNKQLVVYISPHISFDASLITEKQEDETYKRCRRTTRVNVLKKEPAILYEMGIPVMDIECQYSIDVQQKIPLSNDRETVSPSFLQELYAQVLNHTYQELTEEHSSDVWVRTATSDENIQTDAVKQVVSKRFGDKVVVANPSDRKSIDEAIASGYRVVYGSEMSGSEWRNAKGIIKSSTEMFGSSCVTGDPVTPDENMEKVASLAKKIAREIMDIKVEVRFAKWDGVAAQFGGGTLTFNVGALGKGFFANPVSQTTLDLIIHELGHHYGMHTEKAYHDGLTMLGSRLTMIALLAPEFFKEI